MIRKRWTRARRSRRSSCRSMLYASYSRGYKSGGINPPLQPIFAVPDTFAPEFIDAFEVGSKNSFMGGALRLNLTGFYYKYKGLQLSRIIARTSVNDNLDANIYGVEAEAVIRPVRDFQVKLGFSYLHTEVASDKYLSNPRDPSGGRSDVVIIKDIANAAIKRIPGYSQVNAQILLGGRNDRWTARAFVQNLTNNNAITGMSTADASSGLYGNIFTLESRRYGVSFGFRF
ncbi:MAG: TonB-dependent receptor [Sphingomonas sp.]|nr:TonB-dependent receptor [Sphingomonas sp.]